MKLFATLLLTIFSMIFSVTATESSSKKLKVLHLTFHRGCQKEIEAIAKQLGLDLKTWFIPDMPGTSFDGVTKGNCLYNIHHERAERIWNLHKNEFDQFDVILTSDTAPLARIFLQNGWTKPLIIWVCNRFDYHDHESLDGNFPDVEFYQLFEEGTHKKNVTYIVYTNYERHYAKQMGIDLGSLKIEPCCYAANRFYIPSIPKKIVKKDSFFIPPYHNETSFMDLSSFLIQMGIPNYCGRYNGPMDLKDFKAIIHLPYAWSNIAFYENISLGIPYFIPSESFFMQLIAEGNYFHCDPSSLDNDQLLELSEWYCPNHHEIINYFDSWEDLKQKLETTDFNSSREKTLQFAQKHKAEMLHRWRQVFFEQSP